MLVSCTLFPLLFCIGFKGILFCCCENFSELGVEFDADTAHMYAYSAGQWACMKHIDGIVIQPLRKLSTVFFDSIIVINIRTVCRCRWWQNHFFFFMRERVCTMHRIETTKLLLSAYARYSSMGKINVRKLLPLSTFVFLLFFFFFLLIFLLLSSNRNGFNTQKKRHLVAMDRSIRKRNSI